MAIPETNPRTPTSFPSDQPNAESMLFSTVAGKKDLIEAAS
jgi:hypothetical protein